MTDKYVNKLAEDDYEILSGDEYGFYKRHLDMDDAQVKKIAKVMDDYMVVQRYLRKLYETRPQLHHTIPIPNILKEAKRGKAKQQTGAEEG